MEAGHADSADATTPVTGSATGAVQPVADADPGANSRAPLSRGNAPPQVKPATNDRALGPGEQVRGPRLTAPRGSSTPDEVPSYRRFGWFVPFAQVSAGLAVLAVAPSSSAFAPSPVAHPRATFQVADGSSPRSARTFSDRVTTPAARDALRRLEARIGPTFTSWDSATGVPAYVIPRAHQREGISADPSRAAAFADELVTAHLDLLAPGCTSGDWTMVSNRLDGELRTVGYSQSHRGYPVVGGQFSLRVRRDHVAAITSQAIPCAALPGHDATLGADEAAARAQAWVAETDDASESKTLEIGAPVILPRVGDKGILRADLVIPVVVETSSPRGKWRVYVDAQSGEPVARETLLHYTANAVYNVPRRGPLGPRYNAPAALINFEAGGQTLTADLSGNLAIDAPTGLTATVKSPIAAVYNASGEIASSDWVVSPGDTLVWDQRNDELVDAQLSAAIHTIIVKERVRSIDPTNPFLDQQIAVTVNIDDICNAFSDGDSINFFQSSDNCANTAQLADVVYHEFGHSIHHQSLIPGVGAFEGALSEGISDYLSATITGDSGLARGFFNFNPDNPLRELDPDGFEWHWPEDQGEVHDEGRIIGGALWDLRKILRGKLGADAGTARTDYLWYESIRRAIDIPSMYMESLIADDDDGILSNGTPNGCEIAAAYGAHGLRTISATVSDVSLDPQSPEGYPVVVSSDGLLADCPGSGLLGATLTWRERGQAGSGGTLPMLSNGVGGFVGVIPSQPDDVVIQYQVELKTGSDSAQAVPKNAADPWYEFYVGDVEPLYCTDFENNPFAEGWAFGGASSDFEWAPAAGVSGLDPDAAFSGLFVVGNDVAGDGGYNPFTDAILSSPQVDTGDFSRVRLQYRRWLSVEDGFYDQARIYAGGSTVWENISSAFEEEASLHHVDGEWRFHDVDLSSAIIDGKVDVAFALLSDGGLELGGWTIDDVCIVGVNAAAGICGDGIVDPGESCDDGNNLGGDGCSASCETEAGPTSETDTDTDTDSGSGSGSDTDTDSDSDSDTDTDTDTSATGGTGIDLVNRGCVCTSDADAPMGRGVWLALLALVGLRRRRR